MNALVCLSVCLINADDGSLRLLLLLVVVGDDDDDVAQPHGERASDNESRYKFTYIGCVR